MLEARLQSAGGPGPPKWGPCSQIGVYFGHSTFHAGSVALLWNPTTGGVSPQYHVVIDDDLSTMTYMKHRTLPPNWEDIVKYSSEKATTKDVNLADTWMNCQSTEGAMEHLSDPFAIVTDHKKHPQTNTPDNPSPSKIIHTSNSRRDILHGIRSLSSQQ